MRAVAPPPWTTCGGAPKLPRGARRSSQMAGRSILVKGGVDSSTVRVGSAVMGSEIVGRTVRVPNGVNVAAGLVGLSLIAFSLLGDGGWPLSVFIGAIGVLLAGVALANH